MLTHASSHRTEKDKAPPSPHLTIYSDGLVRVQNDQMLVSTCRMHVHKFPFDIQSCNLSFKSVVHTGEYATTDVFGGDSAPFCTSTCFPLLHQSKNYSSFKVPALQRPQT